MFEKIKQLLRKETFSCVIWDGKKMRYQDLTQKEIDEIKSNPKYKNWTIQKEEEC